MDLLSLQVIVFVAMLGSHTGDMSGFFFGKTLGPSILGTSFIKKREKNVFQQKVFTNDPDLISNILPDGELKLAMQRFEISRKKML